MLGDMRSTTSTPVLQYSIAPSIIIVLHAAIIPFSEIVNKFFLTRTQKKSYTSRQAHDQTCGIRAVYAMSQERHKVSNEYNSDHLQP